MDEYTFEQLLRQQRTAIAQGITTVVYAVVLGIAANQIFESLQNWVFGWPFWLALAVTLLLIAPALLSAMRARKNKLTVREMRFTALLLFDQKAEHHEPVQMTNYDLSVRANNDWVNVFKGNQQLRQRYFDSEAQQIDLWGYQQDFDYQLQIQYLEYVILRQFCGPVGPSSPAFGQHARMMAGWRGRIALSLLKAQRRIMEFLVRYPYWQARFQQAKRGSKVRLYFGDYPISKLPGCTITFPRPSRVVWPNGCAGRAVSRGCIDVTA